MIKKIELTNFQSHQNTVLELGGFTAITGQSSSGKTAVIRALNWLFYGDWDALHAADPAKPTAVAIELDNGTRIIRMRQDKNNRAAIIFPGQEPRKFKDFGEEIPGIFDLINVRKIEMGDRAVNLNISDQDEPLFLVNSKHWSKPARAQWLGRLYGAHVVNSMLRLMSSDKRDYEKSVKELEIATAATVEKMAEYNNLEAQEQAISAAEASFCELATITGLLGDLNAYRSKVKVLKDKKWVFDIDTVGMRQNLQDLAKLREYGHQAARVSELRARVSRMAHLKAVDTAAAKDSLRALAGLRDVQDRLGRAKATEAKIEARKAISGLDTGVIRASLEAVKGLLKLRESVTSFRSAVKVVKDKAWLKAMDPIAMREDAARLANLEVIRGEVSRISLKWGSATVKLQGKVKDLKAAYDAAGDVLFAGGKCPLCHSCGVDVSGSEAVGRLQTFMGVSR